MAEKKQQQNQKKKGLPLRSHEGGQGHRAVGKDPFKVLKNVIKSSGLKEAELEAQELDRVGLAGTKTLQKLKTMHQEAQPGKGLVWVNGPAKWMLDAMAAADSKEYGSYVPTEKKVGRAVRDRKAERAAAASAADEETSDALTELQIALSEAGSQE
jgi:hypothetical protein